MLKSLRCLLQQVNSTSDLYDALQLVVGFVRDSLKTQSSSVYLLDREKNCYFLIASVGFKPGVGDLSFRYDQGLVGLVGMREEPININDAPNHPNYLYVPATGEAIYKSFMGVPIFHQRKLLGVLVAQQCENRRFDEAEEAFLVTMSVQLASVIACAEISNDFPRIANHQSPPSNERVLDGIPSAPGVVIGKAVVVYASADLDAVPERHVDDVQIDSEIALFQEALQSAHNDVKALAERLENRIPPEEHAIFDAYLGILAHSSLGVEVVALIREGNWAQGALRKVIGQHVLHFESMEDEYLRERAVDLKDLGRRVLTYLQKDARALPNYPPNTIVVGEEVTASALLEVPQAHLMGIVSAQGSYNSHVAILARAMGIPTVSGIEGLPVGQIENTTVIVDGYHGRVYVSPSQNLLSEFTRLVEEEKELYAGLEELQGLPAKTPDGHQVQLHVNMGLMADIPSSLEVGAEGVGLYRTEVPFMTHDRFPSEEEQRVIYQNMLRAFSPRLVTMRTLDVGGDKTLPYLNITEANPFLGWRGIRITLDHPELFLVQVRAMLRASVGLNNLRVMLPMISSLSEVEEAVRLLKQAHKELIEEGVHVSMPQVGAMIEVPSAVYQVQAIAKVVDFLSIGTNDLTQYILAVDRNNARVANLYDSLHPAVLQAILSIADAARKERKNVSVCGEMAGDPAAVVLLLAMGFDTLSMNATSLVRVKWVIRNFTLAKAQELLQEVLLMHNARQIRNYLQQALEDAGLGGLIRAGK